MSDDQNHPAPCRITPCTCPSPALIGIVHLWLRSVMLTEDANQYMLAYTIGDMEVIETSRDGRVIKARFHPGGEGNGFGLVVNPRWRHLHAHEIDGKIVAGTLTSPYIARRR